MRLLYANVLEWGGEKWAAGSGRRSCPTNPATINARSFFPLAGGGSVAAAVVVVAAVVVGGLRSISL